MADFYRRHFKVYFREWKWVYFDWDFRYVCSQRPVDNKPSLVHMMTSSNGNIFRVTGHLCGDSPVPGEFPTQRPVTRSFDVFFDLRPNKQLSKQWWGWWFETLSWSLWRHCNEITDWWRTGDKLLSELMMDQFTDAYTSFGLDELITGANKHQRVVNMQTNGAWEFKGCQKIVQIIGPVRPYLGFLGIPRPFVMGHQLSQGHLGRFY